MATITLTQVRVAKNGMVSFKANSKRATGTVYFDKKMFPNAVPQTITVTAEGIQEPAPEAPAKPATAPTTPAAADQSGTDQSGTDSAAAPAYTEVGQL